MSATDIDETLPEVVQNFLRSGAKLEKIRLDAAGKWTHEGLDFENPRIIDLFNRSVSRTEGGTWVLEVGRFTYPIEVEDTGFFVERLEWDGNLPTLVLSSDEREELDPTTLEYRPEGRLYCRVRGGAFRARFKKPAYYELAEHIEDAGAGWVVKLGDGTYAIQAQR